jgi:hypothetical protein
VSSEFGVKKRNEEFRMIRLKAFNKFSNAFWFKELRRTPDSELRTDMLTRRLFLRYLLGLPLLSSFPLPALELWADVPVLPRKREGDSIGEFFKGEELHYIIGVWLFNKVALGRISFKAMKEKGRYLSTLQGETLGILGWVARYRTDTYRSVMEEIDGGRRLRSISF